MRADVEREIAELESAATRHVADADWHAAKTRELRARAQGLRDALADWPSVDGVEGGGGPLNPSRSKHV